MGINFTIPTDNATNVYRLKPHYMFQPLNGHLHEFSDTQSITENATHDLVSIITAIVLVLIIIFLVYIHKP
jgi:hypothetical protein